MKVVIYLYYQKNINYSLNDKKIIQKAQYIEVLESGSSLIIGSATDCDVRIRNLAISRYHCILSNTGNDLKIKSLNSQTYGVYSCGQFIPHQDLLMSTSHSAKISLAKTVILDIVCQKIKEEQISYQKGKYNPEAFIGKIFSDFYLHKKLDKKSHRSFLFKATQLSTKRSIIIKALKYSVDNDCPAAKKFRRAVEIASELRHPFLITIYQSGIWQPINKNKIYNVPYLAMEYIEGNTLLEFIKNNGRMSLDKAITLTINIAKVIAYMHQRNIIHRNLGPSNIIVNSNGELVKVIGIGLLKSLSSEDQNEVTFADQESISVIGVPMGVFGFAPPEEIYGNKVDTQADLYSIAALCYFCLTTKTPYFGNVHNVKQKLQKPDDIIDLIKTIPSEINEVLMTALSYFPDNRQPNVDDFIFKLEDFTKSKNDSIFYGLFPECYYSNEKLDFFVGYRPLENVGGDFYTYKVRDNKIFLAMGDLTGHGSAPALIVGLMVGTFNTLFQYLSKPHEILQEVDRIVRPSFPCGYFAEAFCAIIDLEENTFSFSQAGRIPVLIQQETFQIYQQESTCINCLGSFSSKDYQIQLEPNDTIAIVTDGFFETCIFDKNNKRQEFDLHNLQQTLAQKTNSEQKVEQSFTQLYNFTRKINDDLTMMCIQFS